MARGRKVVSLDAYRKKKNAMVPAPVYSALVEAQLKNEFMRHVAPALEELLKMNGLSDKDRTDLVLHLASDYVILRTRRDVKEKP